MDEQRRLGDKWREGDVEVARSLAVPVGQDKVPSLKCSVTSTPLQGSRQRPLSAPLRGSLHKAPGFAGGYLLLMHLMDTNVISAGAPSRPASDLIPWMDQHSASLYLSTVTVAEIEDGIAKAKREKAT